jgi:hypothetical protein
MPLELFNDAGNLYLSITYDAANKWVYSNWLGYQTYDSVVSGAEACLVSLQENQCPYLLNDNRHLLGLWDEAVGWTITDWVPRVIELGLTHFAHVVNPDSMATLTADSLYHGVHRRLKMRVFDDIEIAKAWLRDAQQAASNAA